MKTKVLSLVALFLVGTMSLFAHSKTEKFKVYGKCGMCKSRIEKAAKSVEGVSSADWDKETKQIEVVFNDAKTDVKKIQKAIAKVGHDTEMFKAEDDDYNNLPGCCQYDRPKAEIKMKGHEGHKH
ncbi:Probable Co/Zn/Cd efflux system membrane fusion protein [hydrothermal vent metagenome]|uniref:Probable Co/Zn/Cd efflux system membrane fusion protein n=1 Tax=hydrothermal vent metagenome TaxID=652676 RepID=A0A3B0UE93_9ZZZZ